MTRWSVMAAVAALAFAAAPGLAGDTEMQKAMNELRSAKEHLQAADRDYGGHRKEALRHVDQAIDEVRAGMAVSGKQGARQEKRLDRRETQLEKKQDRIEKRLDAGQQKRESVAE